jgi:peptide-methionine (R)-S-oxide reductase
VQRGSESDVSGKIEKSDAQWRETLSPEQYEVLRKKGTERAFTGRYYDNHDSGTYVCAGCGQELFTSETKYDSGSGWPSFIQPLAAERVTTEEDSSHGMRRVEVLCSRCDGHLGHVFEDGPPPTGQRFCINSAALDFKKRE